MEEYFMMGAAGDDDFVEGELLGDQLVAKFLQVGFHKDMRHPCEWVDYHSFESQKRGFQILVAHPIVWRRDGRLVGQTGSIAEFRKEVRDTYGLEVPVDAATAAKISAENLRLAEERAKPDSWKPACGNYKKIWSNGVSFQGTWRDYTPCRGTITYQDGSSFEGTLREGVAHGKGVFRYANGAKFVGSFAKGKRMGLGHFVDKDDVYDGNYKDGVCHGKGTRTYKSGRQYTGDWLRNYATGKGVENRPVSGDAASTGDAKDQYEGEFLNGRRHGWGMMRYASGDVYRGEWADGLRSGFGELMFYLASAQDGVEGEGEGSTPADGAPPAADAATTAADAPPAAEGAADKSDAPTPAAERRSLLYTGEFAADAPLVGRLAFKGGLTCPVPGEVDAPSGAGWVEAMRKAALEWESAASQRVRRETLPEPPVEFPVKSDTSSLMSGAVSEELWEILRHRLTPGGDTIYACIAPGLDRRRVDPVGLTALSPACYLTFREAFWPVLAKLHPGFDLQRATHANDLSQAALVPLCAALGEHVVSCVVSADRAIEGLPFGAAVDLDQRRHIEEMAAGALARTALDGAYHPAEGSASFEEAARPATEEELREAGVFFAAEDCPDARDFPDARGVYLASDGAAALSVTVNRAEHLTFRATSTSNLSAAFASLVAALEQTESKLKEEYDGALFARLPRLGYVTSDPAALGCAFFAQVVVRLPKMARRSDFVHLASSRGVEIKRAAPPAHPPTAAPNKGAPPSDQYALSVRPRLGQTEVDAVNTLANAVGFLTRCERQLLTGRKTLWLVDEHPSVCVVGGPASAKKALGGRVAEILGIQCIDAADILTEVFEGERSSQLSVQAVAEARACTKSGVPVPTGSEVEKALCERVVTKLRSVDCQASGFVLVGFPRNAAQLQALELVGLAPNKLVVLEEPEAAVQQRCGALRVDPRNDALLDFAASGGPNDKALRACLLRRPRDEPSAVKRRLTLARTGIAAVRARLPAGTQQLILNAANDKEEAQAAKAVTFVREPPPPQ
jgi:adenylate kinase family enzyme